MKWWNKFLKDHLPPGYQVGPELGVYWVGLCLICFSCGGFFRRFQRFLPNLYTNFGRKILEPGAVMKDFHTFLGPEFLGFLVLAGGMVLFAALHYLYFYRESKSIYLMKRLPNPWELHKRCLTLPLLGALVSVAVGFLLLMLCYYVYLHNTPAACLRPGQWETLWRYWPWWN